MATLKKILLNSLQIIEKGAFWSLKVIKLNNCCSIHFQ